MAASSKKEETGESRFPIKCGLIAQPVRAHA